MTVVGVEMQGLLRTSRKHLPEVTSKYRKVVAALDETEGQIGGAFKDCFTMQTVRLKWVELRDLMRTRLDNTTTSLEATADALEQIVVAYGSVDTVAAREISDYARKLDTPYS